MHVVFAGTPTFAIPCLETLLNADSIELVGIYTQVDRPAGRGQKTRSSAVKQFAHAHQLAVFTPLSFQASEVTQLRALRPHLIVVVAYGLLLPPEVLSIPPLGCVNLHASLLPRWRGAAPIQRAIEAGDRTSGISLMQMDSTLDGGAILAQAKIPISECDTSGSLHENLAQLASQLLREHLPAIVDRALPAIPQRPSDACYAAKATRAEAIINWRLQASVLARKVRAFNPSPAMYSKLKDTRLKILCAVHEVGGGGTTPGEIVRVDRSGIGVTTGGGCLVITKVQKAGGKAMPVAALLNGMRIVPGMRFSPAETL